MISYLHDNEIVKKENHKLWLICRVGELGAIMEKTKMKSII